MYLTFIACSDSEALRPASHDRCSASKADFKSRCCNPITAQPPPTHSLLAAKMSRRRLTRHCRRCRAEPRLPLARRTLPLQRAEAAEAACSGAPQTASPPPPPLMIWGGGGASSCLLYLSFRSSCANSVFIIIDGLIDHGGALTGPAPILLLLSSLRLLS